MKLVEAEDQDGGVAVFWLKHGWTNPRTFSAIQFGMFSDVSDPHALPDSVFVDYVADRVAAARRRGATHALLVHMVDESIRNYVVLPVAAVTDAYAQQIDRWPARARTTKTPTLRFEDSRGMPDAECIEVVLALDVPLEHVARNYIAPGPGQPGAAMQKVTAEVERRLQQQRFRLLVGERFGWRCALSGTSIRAVLDAAHLPDRDWRSHNEADDGILVRADLHRLMDSGLAHLSEGRFILAAELRSGEYGQFHGVAVGAENRGSAAKGGR